MYATYDIGTNITFIWKRFFFCNRSMTFDYKYDIDVLVLDH